MVLAVGEHLLELVDPDRVGDAVDHLGGAGEDLDRRDPAPAVGPLEQPLADDAAQRWPTSDWRAWACSAAGKRSTSRVTVSATPEARIVEITRCPTSAAVSAARAVSASSSSPTKITSASWRRPRAQRGGVAGRVAADLALGDDRLLVGVEDLDRVLDGDDVAAALAVDVVDHARRRSSSCPTRAGR